MDEEYKDIFSAEYEKRREEKENEDLQEYASDGCMKVLFCALLILACSGLLIVMSINRSTKHKPKKTPPKTAVQQETPKPKEEKLVTVRESDWLEMLNSFNSYKAEYKKMQETIKALQIELRNIDSELQSHEQQLRSLRNEVNELKKAPKEKRSIEPTPPQSRAVPLQPQPQTKKKDSSTGFKSDALVMAAYQHDCLTPTASFSVRNTTGKTVVAFKVRIIYFDMKGTMLDYQDISIDIKIEPDMVRKVEIEGFGWKDKYVYHQSRNADYGRQYQVDFQLLSYTIK